jgi:hypothetical protein
MQVVRLAPNMGPACSFLDTTIFIKMMETRVAIGLQRAAELA